MRTYPSLTRKMLVNLLQASPVRKRLGWRISHLEALLTHLAKRSYSEAALPVLPAKRYFFPPLLV